jgi:hypothetical protein
VVATGGNQQQIASGPEAQEQAKTVAAGCDQLPETFMVRRGSTVRVRQRAFVEKRSPEIGDFCCLAWHHRAPPHQRRDRYRARRATAKCLQTELLHGSTEPLPVMEVVDGVPPGEPF